MSRYSIRAPAARPSSVQRGPSIAEAEYPDDAIVKPLFKATLVIAEPEVAAGRDVIGTADALAARVGWLVRTLAETARLAQPGPR
jgi:hypothetical protein